MFSTNLFISFIIIIFTPLIGKIIKVIFDLYKLTKKFKNGNSLPELLDRLTPREFEIWSREYLTFLGYHNIILRALDSTDSKNIICTKNNSTFYVLCKNNIVDKFVTSKDVEKLLGTMITDNIKEGLIITTNSLSNNAYKLVANLPSPFSIHIIDLKKSTNYMNNYLLEPN